MRQEFLGRLDFLYYYFPFAVVHFYKSFRNSPFIPELPQFLINVKYPKLTFVGATALQYIDQIMKNLTCQEDTMMVMSKERERQADLLREHQMWQRKIEYLRYDLFFFLIYLIYDYDIIVAVTPNLGKMSI